MAAKQKRDFRGGPSAPVRSPRRRGEDGRAPCPCCLPPACVAAGSPRQELVKSVGEGLPRSASRWRRDGARGCFSRWSGRFAAAQVSVRRAELGPAGGGAQQPRPPGLLGSRRCRCRWAPGHSALGSCRVKAACVEGNRRWLLWLPLLPRPVREKRVDRGLLDVLRETRPPRTTGPGKPGFVSRLLGSGSVSFRARGAAGEQLPESRRYGRSHRCLVSLKSGSFFSKSLGILFVSLLETVSICQPFPNVRM